jgi:hypothetical protein
MYEILADGQPEALESNAHRTNFLAVPAKSAPEDVIGELLPFFLRWAFLAEEHAKEPDTAPQDIPQAFHAMERREHPILGSCNRRADVST